MKLSFGSAGRARAPECLRRRFGLFQMSSCADWIDALTAVFLTGAVGYIVFKILLTFRLDRLARTGADVSDVPKPSWWNPFAHLALLTYRPGPDRPAGTGLLILLLRLSTLVAYVSGGLLFLMLASSSHDANACWRWLPQFVARL